MERRLARHPRFRRCRPQGTRTMTTVLPTTVLPTTIAEYLDQLRRALAGADPALVQDALYDAEEYLRSEMAANLDQSEEIGRATPELQSLMRISYATFCLKHKVHKKKNQVTP